MEAQNCKEKKLSKNLAFSIALSPLKQNQQQQQREERRASLSWGWGSTLKDNGEYHCAWCVNTRVILQGWGQWEGDTWAGGWGSVVREKRGKRAWGGGGRSIGVSLCLGGHDGDGDGKAMRELFGICL